MNLEHFTNILQKQTLVNEDIDNLKQMINQYPYFQSARALYLKGLKDTEDFRYNQALKTTAAYTTDRSILFDYITSDAFLQNEVSKYIKQNTIYLNAIEVEAQDISVNKSVIIDDALKKEIENSKGVLDPKLFQPKQDRNEADASKIANLETNDEDSNINKKPKKKSPPNDTVLNIGKPLEFNKNETHSFNEWLSLTNIKPIKREEKIIKKKTEAALNKAKKFELIDQFISKNHKLEPNKETSSHNIAKAQMIQPEALMTETLARIYLEQKNYKKAIQSYKILSLKYPEKSGFFADQIKAIEQLQDNNI